MSSPFKVIDADGHVSETEEICNSWAQQLPSKYRHLAPQHVENGAGGRHWIIEGKIFPAYKDKDRGQDKPQKSGHMWVHRKGESDPHARMPDMDYMGIDTSVLFCSAMLGVPTVIEDPGLAVELSRVYNNWLRDYCSPYASRLKGVAMMPVQDPKAAATELHRAVEMGLVGALFPPFFNDKMPDHQDYFPLYEAAQELNVPICVHNNSTLGPTRHLLDNFIVRHTFSTIPLQMAMGSIVIGGVLDSFPRLRFAFLEAGAGWVPYIMERMQARYELLPHWTGHLKQSAEEYIKSDQMFYSVEPDESTVPIIAEIIGDERLVIGSDYAHWDGSSPESIRMINERTDINDDQKRKILSDNPARLYML